MYVLCSILMKNEIEEGLEVCFRTAHLLKDAFPNELMKIKKNTIIVNSVENSRLLGGRKGMSSMSNTYAYYDNERKRIVIKQKHLIEQKMYRTKIKNRFDRVMLYGNFALIELICHELAHHRTRGHAKGFKTKYYRFLDYMANQIISGEYYK